MIRAKGLKMKYFDDGDFTCHIKKGEIIAITGPNGAGKTTFAKYLVRLISPEENCLYVSGLDVGKAENEYEIRKKTGFLFQNPENQLFCDTVEEDVAFGPQNMGIPREEIAVRISEALADTGLELLRKRRIENLSGGEKQRAALAGVLAMKPECIIMDESLAMLDSEARRKLIKVLMEDNEKYNTTIIMITHRKEELLLADRIFLIDKGKIERVYEKNNGEIERYTESLDKKIYSDNNEIIIDNIKKAEVNNEKSGIIFNKVSFCHLDVTYDTWKMTDISLKINQGEITMITGKSGTGKTTVTELICGILKPVSGGVYIDGTEAEKIYLGKTGYVGQFPERQLFAETVYDDIIFGPKNMGLSDDEVKIRCRYAMKLTGLDEKLLCRNIRTLSGGEKRRVAMAGILAMKPEYLILDEPAAGLDIEGIAGLRKLLTLLKSKGVTIIVVTHDEEYFRGCYDRKLIFKKRENEFYYEEDKTCQ